jgi:hypothetical protein
MSQSVLRSKIPLEYCGIGTPEQVNKEEFNRMIEERKGQNQPNFCGAVPVGANMWKCDGDCEYDEGAGMFPSCLPFWHGDPNDPDDTDYVYWCQCAIVS